VPWLLPIPAKFGFPPLKSMRITTGKFVESWLVFPGLLAFSAWLFFINYDKILAILHRHLV
jgi:hypothetical protein